MSSPPPAISAAVRADATAQSKLYKLVVTPLVFVSFLFSLAWVEFRYSLLRSHAHGPGGDGVGGSAGRNPHSQMPAWLHRVVYRRQAYEVRVRQTTTTGSASSSSTATTATMTTTTTTPDVHYHSMQSKLLRMEATEAFRIRTTVLCVLGLVVAGAVWTVLWAFWWAVGWLRP